MGASAPRGTTTKYAFPPSSLSSISSVALVLPVPSTDATIVGPEPSAVVTSSFAAFIVAVVWTLSVLPAPDSELSSLATMNTWYAVASARPETATVFENPGAAISSPLASEFASGVVPCPDPATTASRNVSSLSSSVKVPGMTA